MPIHFNPLARFMDTHQMNAPGGFNRLFNLVMRDRLNTEELLYLHDSADRFNAFDF